MASALESGLDSRSCEVSGPKLPRSAHHVAGPRRAERKTANQGHSRLLRPSRRGRPRPPVAAASISYLRLGFSSPPRDSCLRRQLRPAPGGELRDDPAPAGPAPPSRARPRPRPWFWVAGPTSCSLPIGREKKGAGPGWKRRSYPLRRPRFQGSVRLSPAGAGPHLIRHPLPRVSTSPLFTLQLLRDGLSAPCVERFTG